MESNFKSISIKIEKNQVYIIVQNALCQKTLNFSIVQVVLSIKGKKTFLAPINHQANCILQFR